MIKKSLEIKLYEKSDALIDGFRDSVQRAQEDAKSAGVPSLFVINDQRYFALPNGDVKRHAESNDE